MFSQSRILSALTAVLLISCAGAPSQQPNWRHNQLSGQAAQQQHTVDSRVCVADARNAVGPPPTSQTPPNTVTNFSGYTSSGGYISGQATTTTQSPMFGAPNGIQQANAQNQYMNAIGQLTLNCMAQRGWSW